VKKQAYIMGIVGFVVWLLAGNGFLPGSLGAASLRLAAVAPPERETDTRSLEGIRETRELGFPELARILEGHIEKNLPDKTMKAEIKDIRIPEDIVLPRGRLACKVWISEPLRRGGSIGANLVFYCNDQEVKRVRANVQVDLYQTVVVAKRYLKRHQEIREEDVDRIPLNLKGLPPDAVTDLQAVLGKRVLQNINSQEPLRAGLLDIPPLVKKGDIVQVLVTKNNIRVSCLGEIKETGRQGDRVKLVNLTSRKELFGRVVDGGTVAIDWN